MGEDVPSSLPLPVRQGGMPFARVDTLGMDGG